MTRFARYIIGVIMALATAAGAQTTSFYTDRAVGTFPVGSGSAKITVLIPIQYGQVRICTFAANPITPCPAANGTVFDLNGNPLTVQGSNFGQVTTDVTGRFSFGCVVGQAYTIQVAAASSNTPQLSYPVTCPGTALGTSPIFAGITAGTVNSVLWAGPGATPTIDTQITACGSVNPCLIKVSPNYTGTFPPVNTITNNIRIEDDHSPAGTPITSLATNTDTWNGVSGTGLVNSWLRHSWAPTSLISNHSYELTTNFVQYTGTLPNGQAIEGITSNARTVGAITTPGGISVVGMEGAAQLSSTGGTVTTLVGVNGHVESISGNTTNATNAISIQAQAPVNAGGTLTNAYALKGIKGNAGSTRNYAIMSQGDMLFSGPNDNGDAFNIDFEDHTGIAQHFIQYASPSDNIIEFTTGGTRELRAKGQLSAVWRFSSSFFTFDPDAAGYQVVIGTTAGFKFSGGNAITNSIGGATNGGKLVTGLAGTATLTYTSIAAQTGQEQTLTITGAPTANLGVTCSPQATLGNVNLVWSAWVSAINTVSVRVINPTTGAITPSAVVWGCTVNF